MAELIDFSYDRFSPAEVKALGRVGIIRYVASGRPGISATKQEVDAFRSAGLLFVAVWQRGKDRALSGRPGGVVDAKDAAAYTAGLGAGELDAIHFSVDVDATDAQLPTVLAYFEGIAEVLGWHRVGVYGGIRTLEYLHERTPMSLFWQTASWSGGRLAPFATLYQYKVDTPSSPVRLNGKAVDFDRSLTPYYGAWGTTLVDKPEIRQAPLGPQTQPLMARHDIVCVHTMVGYLVSTDQFFRVSNGAGYDGTESHYGMGGKWGPDLGGGWDGRIWQWQSLARTADANLEGNPRVISIETADNAARPIAPWTPAQVASLADLIAWLCSPAAHAGCPETWVCRREGIPAQLVPDTQSHRRGLAYHAQGARDHTVGEWWSTTPSKDCPTDPRIAQFKQDVIPGVQRKLANQEEGFMAALTDAEQQEVLRAARQVNSAVGYGQVSFEGTIEALLRKVNEALGAIRANAAVVGDDEQVIVGKLDEVKTAVEALAPAKPEPTPEPAPVPTPGA